MDEIKAGWEWLRASVDANPQAWGVGFALFLAVCLGWWLHKRATGKEKKS